MMIRCPNCERIGKIPDQLGSSASKLRCRRCRARFSLIHPPGQEGLALASRLFEASPIAQSTGSFPRFPAETWSANGAEPDDSLALVVNPDDSQYELPISTDIDIDDSQFELPAFAPEQMSREESWRAAVDNPPSMERTLTSPWHDRFVNSWGHYHFGVTIGFSAISLAVLGYFLASEIFGGRSISASIALMILGCVGTVAFLLLSVTVTALNRQLADLAKHVRLMRIQSDPKTRIVGE
jgi:zinc-ribbon domain